MRVEVREYVRNGMSLARARRLDLAECRGKQELLLPGQGLLREYGDVVVAQGAQDGLFQGRR